MKKALIPLGIFIVLVAFLAIGLTRDPKEIPSPLIHKPAPNFSAPRLHAPAEVFTPKEMLGKVWLLNVWASWCVACREEHPVLVELGRSKVVPLIGLNYKDDPEKAQAFLDQLGDPFATVGTDRTGRVAFEWGVYGVPETFLIDGAGRIVMKHVGPLRPEDIPGKIIPAIEAARQ